MELKELYLELKNLTLYLEYEVYDEEGNCKYYAKADELIGRSNIVLYDGESNEEIFTIKHEKVAGKPLYRIYGPERIFAEIAVHSSFRKTELDIESMLGKFIVNGNITKKNYEILKDDMLVAKINKNISLASKYTLAYTDEKIAAFLTAISITIDTAIHNL